jgi:hypothetical protein
MVAVKLPELTVYLQDPSKHHRVLAWFRLRTYTGPEQTPEVKAPWITSQYTPFARPVANVAVQAESALLIATKPVEPALRRGLPAHSTYVQ